MTFIYIPQQNQAILFTKKCIERKKSQPFNVNGNLHDVMFFSFAKSFLTFRLRLESLS